MHDGPLECGDCAEDNPSLRKQISSAFAHWQYTIGTVIQQAVTQNELPATNESNSLAAFLLDSWEGALLRSQAEKNDAQIPDDLL